MKSTKINYFQNEIEASLFLIFILFLPLGTVFASFILNDRTFYVILFITLLGLCYNYISILFNDNLSKRIFFESIFLLTDMIAGAFFCPFRLLIFLSTNSQNFIYTPFDLWMTIGLLLFPLIIYVLETCVSFSIAYKHKVKDNTHQYKQDATQCSKISKSAYKI